MTYIQTDIRLKEIFISCFSVVYLRKTVDYQLIISLLQTVKLSFIVLDFLLFVDLIGQIFNGNCRVMHLDATTLNM